MKENKDDDEANFDQLFRLMHDEDLIRFRRRAEKHGLPRMAELLTQKLKEREALEKAEHASKKK